MSVASQIKGSFAIAKKDMLIFYFKGPVIIMGLLFPLFLFAAFIIGKNLTGKELFTALISMSAFFTATAVGPTIIPWEARSKTFERLISSPVTIGTILLGDMQASFYFGFAITATISLIVLFLNSSINIPIFIGGLILGIMCFSSLTILMSSYPPTDVPADVMMLSSLVKFSLLFISGIFIPVQHLPYYGRVISFFSPLTYFVDLMKYAANSNAFFPVWIDFLLLASFTLIFFFSGVLVHKKVLEKRFM